LVTLFLCVHQPPPWPHCFAELGGNLQEFSINFNLITAAAETEAAAGSSCTCHSTIRGMWLY